MRLALQYVRRDPAQFLQQEGVREFVLPAVGEQVVPVAASMRDHDIVGIVIVRIGVGLGPVTEHCTCACVGPLDRAVIEVNHGTAPLYYFRPGCMRRWCSASMASCSSVARKEALGSALL